jgi:deoxyribose-phosphate aldolase
MKLNKYIDHTILKADAKKEDIKRICEEAKKYNFASVCVNPANVKYVSDLLKGSEVKTCCGIPSWGKYPGDQGF